MNLNPFVYQYKTYTNCPLATALSGILAGIQRVFICFALLLIFFSIVEDVENAWEAQVCAIGLLIIYIVLRKYKNIWTDKLAIKEAKKNS